MMIENLGFTGHKKKEFDRTKDKLHLLSLFSKNDFSSPAEIFSKADKLVQARYNNIYGFTRTITNIFNDYAKTKDSSAIKYNDLLATIFSFYRHDNKVEEKRGISKIHDWIVQSEISNVVDCLQGNNLDFTLNKKNFLLSRKILPAYFLMRSFKENDNEWLGKILVRFNKQEKEELIKSIIDLKTELISFVNLPNQKATLRTQFKKSLEVERVNRYIAKNTLHLKFLNEQQVEEIKEKWKAKNKANLKNPTSTYVEMDDKFYEPEFRYNRSLDESADNPKEMDTLEFFGNLLDMNQVMINSQGQVTVNQELFKKFTKILRLRSPKFKIGTVEEYKIFEKLTQIFGIQDYNKIASFSTMISLSSSKSSFPWDFDQLERKDYVQIRKLTKAFEESISTLWNDDKVRNELTKSLSKIIHDVEGNFSVVNSQLGVILYKNYFSTVDEPKESELFRFTEQPGVREGISSLKKLFLTNLLQTQYQSLPQKAERSFILSPSDDVWPRVKNPSQLLQVTDSELDEPGISSPDDVVPKKNIIPKDLKNWKDWELVKALAFLVVENYSQLQGKYFENHHLKTVTIEKEKYVSYPDEFRPNEVSIIKSTINGLGIPILRKSTGTMESGKNQEGEMEVNYQDNYYILYFRDDNLSRIPIEVD